MFDSMQKTLIAKWYQFLLILSVGNLLLTLASFLPIDDNMITWARYVVFLFSAYCLLQLRLVSVRYRKAAVFKGLMVLCSVLNAMMAASLTLAVSGISILATYLEYVAHAKAIQKTDAALSRKWYRLFNIGLLVSALSVLVSMVAAALLSVSGGGIGLFRLISYLVIAAELALQVFYLLLLNRTKKCFLETEE